MSDFIDFNDANEQLDMSALIPHGTFARVSVKVRANDESGLTKAKGSDSKMIDCEFEVVAGRYATKKFWTNLVVSGITGRKDSSGKIIAHNISKATLRAILESAKGIIPEDASAGAVANRKLSSYMDFSGMEFATKINIQKAKAGTQYDDKNILGAVVTPDKENYSKIMSGGTGGMNKIVVTEPPPKKPSGETGKQWGTKPAIATATKETQVETPPPADEIPDWAR